MTHHEPAKRQIGRVPKVTLVSAGQLSTCPRMVKVADALHEKGYAVRCVSSRRSPWAVLADGVLLAKRPWLNHHMVDTTRGGSKGRFLRAGIRQKCSLALAKALSVRRAPMACIGRAVLRSFDELLAATVAEPADFLYSCGGSFPMIREAARRMGVGFGLDFEDLHSGQMSGSEDTRFWSDLWRKLERDVGANASFLTMGSPSIADAYRERLGFSGITIHNVVSLPRAPDFGEAGSEPSGTLRLFWFSQTIGPDRGIEDAIGALGVADIEAQLTLQGSSASHPDYPNVLKELAARQAPKTVLRFLEPTPADGLVEECRKHDIGLALEQGDSPNSQLALSNKIFTYLASGLAVIFSATPAQRAFRESLGDRQGIYEPKDAEALGAILRQFAQRPETLDLAKRDAWTWAERRWHWEHADERGRILACFEEQLPRRAQCA